MPDKHHEPGEAGKSLLEALRTAIAEGDADLAAGRFRTYQAGDLVREMCDLGLTCKGYEG